LRDASPLHEAVKGFWFPSHRLPVAFGFFVPVWLSLPALDRRQGLHPKAFIQK
jgi:hypothetical protein